MPDSTSARQRHERASEILLDVRDLRGAERDAAIREACGDDAALRELVESLAAHVDDDDSPTGLHTGVLHAAIGAIADHVAGLREATPAFTRIGRYRIVGVLGSGGMGEVLEAEQDRPKRHVAVKVLRSGVASREVVARFDREAQVLGQLQHPGIAQIHEAGVADSEPPVAGGVAFIAMELVRGLSLTEHARTAKLSTHARLELLARVCDAVHHAHLRGFVHRDIKPSNILVDERGQPKVLDFGVARASSSDLTVATLHTTVGQLIGTIAYMSPEQASGDASTVDARSDVHALGVLAAEILTGKLPLDVRALPVPDALRKIREDDPTRIGSLDSRLRGDVETIVAKALEKDPQRRYQSAAEMAADIRRHLAHEPIHARPPSTTYQLAKFTRRNKALVAGVLIAFVALAIGALLLDRARRREMVQRQAADASAHQADEERRAALQQAYLASLTAGITSLESDNVRAAVTQLDAAPESLRGWEWRHARARADDSTMHLELPPESASSAAWSDDGRRLVATHADGLGRSTVRVWDSASARVVADCGFDPGADVSLSSAECLPYAAFAMSIPAGASVLTIRDAATSAPLLVVPRLPGSEGAMALGIVRDRPDIAWGQTKGRFGWIRLGSSEWTSVDLPAANASLTWARAVDPAGQRIVMSIADTGRAEIRELATLRLVTSLQQADAILDLTWTLDGQRVLTAGRGGDVRAYDARTGRQVAETSFDDPMMAIAACDTIIAVGGASGLIRLLDVDTLALRGIRRGSVGNIGGLSYSPQAHLLASTASNDAAVRTWSPSTDDPRLIAHHEHGVYDVAVVAGTRMVVSAATDGTLRWSDMRTGERLATRGCSVAGQNAWLFLAPSPDARLLAALGPCAEQILVVLDAVTGEKIGGSFVAANWWFAGWTDSQHLIAGSAQGLVVRWDVASWTESARWQAERLTADQDLEGLAASADGSRLAAALVAGGGRATMVILDANHLSELARSTDASPHAVVALAWSPDGSRIVCCGNSGILEVVDGRTASLLDARLELGATPYELAFSPDGTRLVAALADGSFSVVSWPELREVARFHAHDAYVHAVAWLADGSGIVTGSGDGTVRSWTTWPLGDQLADRARAEPRRVALGALVRALRAESTSWRDCVERIRASVQFAAGDDRALALQVAARLAAADRSD